MNKDQAIANQIAENNKHIRSYTSQKLAALTAIELIETCKKLPDRTRLEIVLTNKLEAAIEELKKLTKNGKEESEQTVALQPAIGRKSKIAGAVSNLFASRSYQWKNG
jgi:hypothetical protein